MPKFEKSTGYAMKGSTFYGKKISSGSPLRISDRDVVAAQAQLDKVETKFRQPGWAKAASKAVSAWKNPMSKGEEGAEFEGEQGGNDDEDKTQSVKERMGNTGDLSAQQTQQTKFPQSSDDYKIETKGLGGMPYRVRVDNKRR